MANELNLQVTVTYTKGNDSLSRGLSGLVSVASTARTDDVQNIGTTETTLNLGTVTPTGYAFFHNLDATNYVELGKATGVYVLKLLAGEFALLRLDTWSTIFAKANTAAVDLEYCLFSN